MNLSQIEEKILKFWEERKIFEKSVKQRQGRPYFSFYDGPPFATGLPHYGHILSSVSKDVMPRYFAMRGFKVERRWGWDCHGLPIENIIEEQLGIKSKVEIEKDVAGFNRACRETVLKYAQEWKKMVRRIGRFVDFDNSYKTMDTDYMESVWWAFKELWQKGLVYEDYRTSLYCPRCVTPLSNFEIAMDQSYKEETDETLYVLFKRNDKENEYFVAWTTTPWTLLANVALAVSSNLVYAKVKKDNKILILAEKRLEILEKDYQVLEKIKGKDLIGIGYEPIFPNKEIKKSGYRVVPADFVSGDDGSGIVHIAPAFGQEDFELSRKESLPMFLNIDEEGRFIEGAWKGEKVWSANQKIGEDLKRNNFVLKMEKVTHSYPFCWRCETKLIYKAQKDWFIKVTVIKKELLKQNEKINWHPAHLKKGRFGKGLETAPDWNISRSRYWGNPIPIWRCEKCDDAKIIGSIDEMKQWVVSSGNKYFLMRHGEAESNAKGVINANIKDNNISITDKGRKDIIKAAKKLKKKKINVIFSSDFLRTKQTAEIVAEELAFDKNKIIYDSRLRELNVGIFHGQHIEKYRNYFTAPLERFKKAPPKGENLDQLQKRGVEFLLEIDKKFKSKNILIVGHLDPIWMMVVGAKGQTETEAVTEYEKKKFLRTGDFVTLDFYLLPRNENHALDLHRPYIDEIKLECNCGGEMARIDDVFDCWVESGAMPFAELHYPFANKEKFKQRFPADFISEYIAQTRGWFYTLHVLAVGLFGKPSFLNAVTTGTILNEKGEKLSKSRKNFPDPWDLIAKYPVDALRLYLMASSVMLAENLNFSEKEVEEVYRRDILTIYNVLSFFALYSPKKFIPQKQVKSRNKLDQWILSKIESFNQKMIVYMDSYEMAKAARLVKDFVDDFSNWYIRRSRRRFQKPESLKEQNEAAQIFYYVLKKFSLLIAPFAPFVSEEIYQNLKGKNDSESVHLCDYPKPNKRLVNKRLEDSMRAVREIVAKGLALRMEKKIKVRQPLQKLKIKSLKLKVEKELIELIKDELNVKEVVFDKKIKDEIELDTEITPELKEEGMAREVIRQVQNMRKEAGVVPKDVISIMYQVASIKYKDLFQKRTDYIKKETNAKVFEEDKKEEKFDLEKEINLDGEKIKIGIRKSR